MARQDVGHPRKWSGAFITGIITQPWGWKKKNRVFVIIGTGLQNFLLWVSKTLKLIYSNLRKVMYDHIWNKERTLLRRGSSVWCFIKTDVEFHGHPIQKKITSSEGMFTHKWTAVGPLYHTSVLNCIW